MSEEERQPVRFTPGTLLGLVVTATVLYFAQEVIIPLSLAILLSFLLATPVVFLQRHKFGHVPSVVVVVTLAFALLAGIGWLVTAQFYELAKKLPEYQQTIETKLKSVQTPGGGTLERLTQMVKNAAKGLQKRSETGAPQTPPAGPPPSVATEEEPKPIPVEVHQPKPTPLQLAKGIVGPIFKPLALAGIVIVFVIFMLLEREALRDRLIRLGGIGRMHLTTQAFDEAASRVSRYLFMQLVVNLTYGIPIGIGLYFIGVPSPLLWGTLATLLRFIPYVGPWIAASFPIALAFAVDPGWSMLLWTVALFVVVELISNNLIEPWLYGASTGLSAVAILVAAVFWTWLWGPVGLFLSTPLTVCLVVLGRHVPQLAFLNILLGDQPVLTPESRFYQRLLAMDEEGASEVAEEFLQEKPLVDLYDTIILPALHRAEEDRARGVLPENRQKFILHGVRVLVEELIEDQESSRLESPAAQRNLLPALPPSEPIALLCLPAKDEADEIAGLMLAQLLKPRAIQASSLAATLPTAECLQAVEHHQPAVVCISSVPPSALRHARFLCRKIRDRFPDIKVVVGLWDTSRTPAESQKNLPACTPDVVVTSLREAVEKITPLLSRTQEIRPKALPPEEQPVSEKQRQEVLETPPEELFDQVKRELARTFNVPLSLISLLQTDQHFWKAQAALPSDLAEVHENPQENSMADYLLAENETLIIPDVKKDKRFTEEPIFQDRGIRFFAATPLRTRQGHTVGSLCVIDTQPREIAENDKVFLEQVASQLMEQVEARRTAVAV